MQNLPRGERNRRGAGQSVLPVLRRQDQIQPGFQLIHPLPEPGHVGYEQGHLPGGQAASGALEGRGRRGRRGGQGEDVLGDGVGIAHIFSEHFEVFLNAVSDTVQDLCPLRY